MKYTVVNFRIVAYTLLAASAFALQGCGLGKKEIQGELIGVQGREGWTQAVPYGMTTVPSGTFHMGQSDEDVAATHINYNKQVTIGGFYMDDTEITNNEYRQFVVAMSSDDTTGIGNLTPEQINIITSRKYFPDTTVWMRDFSHHMGDPMMEYYYMHPAFDQYPVVGVSYKSSKLFCRWRTGFLNKARSDAGLFGMPSFRLPSEAEWEYAAGAGATTTYEWGDEPTVDGNLMANTWQGRFPYRNDGALGWVGTSPIGTFPPNGFGLLDMIGNVWEWTADAFNPYPGFVADPYKEYSEPWFGTHMELRGGSFSTPRRLIRNTWRNFYMPRRNDIFAGFRTCALN
jgi:EgtB-related family protein